MKYLLTCRKFICPDIRWTIIVAASGINECVSSVIWWERLHQRRKRKEQLTRRQKFWKMRVFRGSALWASSLLLWVMAYAIDKREETKPRILMPTTIFSKSAEELDPAAFMSWTISGKDETAITGSASSGATNAATRRVMPAHVDAFLAARVKISTADVWMMSMYLWSVASVIHC